MEIMENSPAIRLYFLFVTLFDMRMFLSLSIKVLKGWDDDLPVFLSHLHTHENEIEGEGDGREEEKEGDPRDLVFGVLFAVDDLEEDH